nr:uncharacterized protein LOC113818856 [Penaeus vannamei]
MSPTPVARARGSPGGGARCYSSRCLAREQSPCDSLTGLLCVAAAILLQRTCTEECLSQSFRFFLARTRPPPPPARRSPPGCESWRARESDGGPAASACGRVAGTDLGGGSDVVAGRSVGGGGGGGNERSQIEIASLLYRYKNDETIKRLLEPAPLIYWIAYARPASTWRRYAANMHPVRLCGLLLVANLFKAIDNDIAHRNEFSTSLRRAAKSQIFELRRYKRDTDYFMNTKLGFKELSHVTTSRLNVFHLLTFTGSGDRKDSGLTDSITAGRFLFSQPQSASKGRQPQSDKETRTEADRVEAPNSKCDGGRPSIPDGIPQGHAAAISPAGAPLVAKGERRPDLQVRKASDEHPRPLKTSLYGAGSLQRPRVGRTSDGKRSVRGNTKTARESRIVRKADGARQKLPSGESESSKKRKQKRKDKRARTKERQQKRRNKGNKKTRKNGTSKKASPPKKKVKKGNSQRSNRNKNKKAREPKEEKQKKNNKNSHKKKIVKSSTKKLEGEIRQISDGSCDVSTKVGKGEVVAVESRATSEAVDCKHKIRASKGATLKMTCPRFSLSPSRCKEEKVVIKEIGKGNFKKKYCKGKIPGEEVSDAGLEAVTLLHRRAKLKGKQCAVGFLCLFSTSEISSKVSECRGKYKLQEGESMIVAPSTFRDKVSCRYTFKSPKGTTLALSCPSFNLSERGCGRERVIVREKKAKYKKKFCKTSNPAKERSQTTSNHFTITHKRKKLKDKECERGFWCQVSVVKGKTDIYLRQGGYVFGSVS